MEFIYIISFILLFISIYLFRHNNKPISYIIWFVIDLWLVFIINSIIVFIFSLFNIPANLLVRSILFILLSIPLYYRIIKYREIQKFSFNTYEIFFLVISMIITIIIGIYRFGSNFDLYFETTDPANHYMMAERFASSNKLLEMSPADKVYGKADSSTLFLSYTTVGTLFQLSKISIKTSFIEKVNIFLIFELLIIFFSLITLLYITNNHVKKWNLSKYIKITLLLILYVSGYIYNNLLFGFHYLGICILLIEIIIFLVDSLLSKKTSYYNLILLSLFNFSIFSGYYMFVPIVYGAIGLYILYYCMIKKEYPFKEALKYIIISLVIPFVIGIFYYFIYSSLVYSNGDSINPFKMEGYIYRNLISNFIFIIIIIIYKFFWNIIHKEITILDFSLLMNLGFILILFYLLYNNSIASYYYYKLYYPLWMFCYIDFSLIIVSNEKEFTTFSSGLLITIFLLFVCQISDIDNKLQKRNELLNNNTFVDSITNIYWFNKIKSNKELFPPIFTKEELINLKGIFNKYDNDLSNSNYVFYGDLLEKLWLYNFTNTIPIPNFNDLSDFYYDNIPLDNVNINKDIKYILYKTSEANNYYSDKFEIIYVTDTYTLASRI